MPADPQNEGILKTLWDTLKGKRGEVKMYPDRLDEFVKQNGKKKPLPPKPGEK